MGIADFELVKEQCTNVLTCVIIMARALSRKAEWVYGPHVRSFIEQQVTTLEEVRRNLMKGVDEEITKTI